MKLRFDQNLSYKLCRMLEDVFPGSEQVRRLGLSEADNRAVWRYAAANGFVLVTLDADFVELTTVLGSPPKLIWLRRSNQRTEVIEQMLRDNAETIKAFESDDAVCLEIY